MRVPTSKQRGIALILVLWLMALLTLMAAAYATSTRTEIRMTRVTLERAQAQAVAEAGLWRGVQILVQPGLDPHWHIDGQPNHFRFADHAAAVRVIDETGKLDLNTGRAEILDGLLASAGVAAERRVALVDAILDWRDPDSLRRTHGAEDNDYRRMGVNHGAKDGPFNSVSELQQVAGMDHALYERIAPALTVYSHQPGINVEAASAQMLGALPGATTEAVETYSKQRDTAELEGVHPRFLSRGRSRAYTVESTARVGDVTYTLSAIIAPQPGGELPYAVIAWQPE